MANGTNRLLFWAPRALCILLIGFVSMFALDVFSENRGFSGTLVALAMHLVPSLVMVVMLWLAWRWEWIGMAALHRDRDLFRDHLPGPLVSEVDLRRASLVDRIALPFEQAQKAAPSPRALRGEAEIDRHRLLEHLKLNGGPRYELCRKTRRGSC